METLEESIQNELRNKKASLDPLGFRWWAIPIEDLWEILEDHNDDDEWGQ